jgi:tetratricopeptide (TPR) repeat protein
MTEPHVRLAASADKLIRGDSTMTYLDRAKFLSPMNATIWYLCGKQEFLSEQWDDAWTSWRRSLELADLHLLPILDQARSVLSDQEMLKKVFPDKPKVLFVAGMYLQPNEAGREGQKLFLEKALSALDEQEEPSKDEEKGENLFLKGMINDILGRKKEAITGYQAALLHPPKDKEKEINWRLSYARLLYEEGQLKESERQLRTVLSQQPGHDHAKTLLTVVRREGAKKIDPLPR